jgi:hypothetical protein
MTAVGNDEKKSFRITAMAKMQTLLRLLKLW